MDILTNPIPNPAAIFQEAQDGWAVLVNLDSAGSLALNPTGVVVWKLVNGKHNLQEIIAAVKTHFKDVPDTVVNDVVALLGTLTEEGLIGYEWGSEFPNQRVGEESI